MGSTRFSYEKELGPDEVLVYGHDAVRDPVSGRIFEMGSGALSRERQALLYAAEAKKGGRLNELEAQLVIAQAEKKT